MQWVGTWRNFDRTARQRILRESVHVIGVHQGDCVSFTGLFRDGEIQTMWHVLSDSAVVSGKLEKIGWAHAAHTNADTFERID